MSHGQGSSKTSGSHDNAKPEASACSTPDSQLACANPLQNPDEGCNSFQSEAIDIGKCKEEMPAEAPKKSPNIDEEQFHLYVHRDAIKVTVSFQPRPNNSDQFKEPEKHELQSITSRHWKVSIPVKPEVTNVKYNYTVHYQKPKTIHWKKCEQQYVRTAMCGQKIHYDIFKECNEKPKPDKIFGGKLFFMNMLYEKCKEEDDISLILEDIQLHVDLSDYHVGNLNDKNKQSFYTWVNSKIKAGLTPNSSAVICLLLAQFFRKRLPDNFLQTLLSNDVNLAKLLLINLQNLPCLPEKAKPHLEHIHNEIVKAVGKRTTWTSLDYIVMFVHLFPKSIQKCADRFCDPKDDDFEKAAKTALNRLISIQDLILKDALIKYVISKAPSIPSLVKLFRELSTSGYNEPYENVVINRYSDILPKQSCINSTLWKEIPEALKPRLASTLLKDLLRRAEERGQPVDDKLTSELILDKDLQEGAHHDLVAYLKFLSSSCLQSGIMCQVLKNESFQPFWKKMNEKDKLEIVRRITSSKFELVVSKNQTTLEYVMATFGALNDLSEIIALNDYISILEDSIKKELHSCSLETIVKAYDEIPNKGKRRNTLIWYTTVVTECLTIKRALEPKIVSKLLDHIFSLSSSEDSEMSRRIGNIISKLLVKSKVPEIMLRSDPNEKEAQSVVSTVLSEQGLWKAILQESRLTHHRGFSKHPKVLEVNSVMDFLAASFIDGRISINCIKGESRQKDFANFLSLGRRFPPGIEAPAINLQRKWMEILSRLSEKRNDLHKRFELLEKSLSLASEITDGENLASLKDLDSMWRKYNNLKEMLEKTKFADVCKLNYWGPLESLFRPAESIDQLSASVCFKNFARNRLNEECITSTSKDNQTGDVEKSSLEPTVEEILVLLEEEIEAFKNIFIRINDHESEVTSKELDILLLDISAGSIQKELRCVCESLHLSGISQNSLGMLKDYLRFNDVQPKIRAALECLNTVGYGIHPIQEDRFLKSLKSFLNCKESGTLKSVSECMNDSSIMEINNKLQSTDLFETLRELTYAKDLVEFIISTAKDNMADLVEAVEEHSDQLLQPTTVYYLIDVHRFLRELLCDKPTESKNFLAKIFDSYEIMTKEKPSSIMRETKARGEEMMSGKIKVVSNHVHSLKSLHMTLSNRDEVTKEIIQSAIKIGSYRVWIDTDDSIGVELKYKKEDQKRTERKHNLDDLNDLRSRALLLVNSEKIHNSSVEGGTELADYQRDLKLFIEQVDLLSEIVRLYKILKESGKPQYDNERGFWRENLKTMDEIRQEEERANKESNEWNDMIQTIRKKYYLLSYFHTKQLWILNSFFKRKINRASEVAGEVLALFHFIDAKVTRDDVLHFHSQYTEPTVIGMENELCAIGKVLEKNFISFGKKSPTTAKKKNDVVEPSKLYINVLKSNSVRTVHVIMDLFKSTCNGLPEPSQLLFCTRNTTWNEIDLLLFRTFKADEYGYPSNLHCIANVEALPDDIHLKLVETIEALSSSTEAPYLLAIVCRGKHQHIAEHFSDFAHHHGGMPDTDMEKAFREHFPDVLLVTGNLPGLGKSERIYTHASENERAIVTFPITGPFVRENLIKRLSTLSLKHFQSIHFVVGEVDDPDGLEAFLFELVATKMVSAGHLMFSLTTKHVYIEVANTLQLGIMDSLPVCSCFERLEVGWEGCSNLLVSNELTSCIQVVCQYLNAYENESLEHEEVVLSGSKKVEPLGTEQCQKLLKKQFCQKNDHVNFSILHNFLSVLANQLLKFSRNPYLKPSNLSKMVDGQKNIREDLFKVLLAVSTRFTKRSINIFENQKSAMKAETKAEQMVERVKGMIQWAEVQHLLIMFHSSGSITPIYCSLSKVPQNVKELFMGQDVLNKGLEDYSKMSQKELQIRLERFSGAPVTVDEQQLASMNYALTPDNLMKMALIIQRMQAGIPVIIMGETGCGKTSLVQYLARTCSVPFKVFSFHAGITEKHIVDFISKKDKEARNLHKEGKSMWLFLDEINTCDYLGIINEIVCNRSIHGRPLAPNLMFVAACNPYRLRSQGSIMTSGLTEKTMFDEFSKLVYRVHPLPETMIDYVWDYGSLSDDDEKAYIGRMVTGLFEDTKTNNMLVDLLATSQQFIREEETSSFCVSLRDVNRCKILVDWFYKMLQNRSKISERQTTENLSNELKQFFFTSKCVGNTVKAIVLSLAHCFLLRLRTSHLRQKYCSKMTEVFRKHNRTEVYENVFQHIVRAEQEDYLSRMELPDGTAKNAALRENVFVLLVCILNRIPVFVVGKPGCSKSLSMQIIRSNLRGTDSKDPFLRTLPKLMVVSFQGSESSTSEGIEKVFSNARKYKFESALPVVLLDEIGLAEMSKFNPLKVLHQLLETENGQTPDVAVVGLSNWALDAAKMNRAIHLSCTEPDEGDLYKTGLSIRCVEGNKSSAVASAIKCLAEAYYEYQSTQNPKNFHGLRDYYSTVKSFDVSSRSSDCNSKEVQRSLQRNFGGTPVGSGPLQEAFLKKLESFQPRSKSLKFHVTDLIKDNLHDKTARHLMLITSGDSAIGILNQTLSDLEKKKVTIFGSYFEEDISLDYSHRILSRIILCMEHDCVLILRDLERVYGSLYDMLNQNYLVVGGKKNCRVALGVHSSIRQVHDGFRCIVLIEESNVDCSDPPFLNRFEKQLLRFSDVLNVRQKKLIEDLRQWVKSISSVEANGKEFNMHDMFAGFHEDTLPSIILSHSQSPERSNDEILDKCKDDLMSVAIPDAVIRIHKSNLHSLNKDEAMKMYDNYLKKPIQNGLKAYLEHSLKIQHGSSGMTLLVMTHSSIHFDVSLNIKNLFEVQSEKLSLFKSEKTLSLRIKRFFLESKANLLIVQCRPETDAPHILLLKNIIEEQKQAFIDSHQNITNQKHVCIVIHLCRSTTANVPGHRWQFNFLSGWSQVMIDSLEEPLIKVKEFLDVSVVKLIENQTIPFKKIAEEQLPWCFNRMKFKLSEQPDHHVVSSLEKAMIANADVMDCFMKLCCKWIGNGQDFTRCEWEWKIDVACDRQELINSSTLVKAMERFIIQLARRPLARIIYFLWNNSAFGALISANNIHLRQECLKLLSRESIFKIEDAPEPQGIESLIIDCTCKELQFPFSYLFYRRIEDLYDFFDDEYRLQCQNDDNLDENEELTDDSKTVLVKKVSLKVRQVITEINDSKILSQYVSFYQADFLDIKTNHVSGSMSRKQRIEIMQACYGRSSLSLNRSDIASAVASLHCNFWLEGNEIPEVFYFIEDCASTGRLCIDALLKQYRDFKMNKREAASVAQRLDDTVRKDNSSSLSTRYDRTASEDDHNKKPEENDEPPKQPEENEDGFAFPVQETQDDCCDRAVACKNTADEHIRDSSVCNTGEYGVEYCQNDGCYVDEDQEVSKTSPFEDFLVQEVCLSFLPNEDLITKVGGLNEWKSATCLILSSATTYCSPTPAYYFLKICYEFACTFEDLNPLFDLGKIGSRANEDGFLDSRDTFEAVCNIVGNHKGQAAEDGPTSDKFLFFFYEKCIQSNPDSPIIIDIVKKVSCCANDDVLPLKSSLLKKLLLTAYDQTFSLEDVYRLMTSGSMDKLKEISSFLSQLQSAEEELDCHINVISCDLINSLAFKELDVDKIKSSSDLEIEIFLKAIDVLTEPDESCKGNVLRFTCAVSYLRAFMSDLARSLSQTQSTNSLEKLLQDISVTLEDVTVSTRKSSVSRFLLKELCRVMCLYDVKLLVNDCNHLHFLKSLGWEERNSLNKLYGTPLKPEVAKCHTTGEQAMECTNPESSNTPLQTSEKRLQRAIDHMERFYIPRSIRNLKDTEVKEVRSVTEHVTELPTPYEAFTLRITGKESFKFRHLNVSTDTSAIDVQVAVLINHLSAILTSSFSGERWNPIMFCLTKPKALKEHYMVTVPESDSGYPLYKHYKKTALDNVDLCSCKCGRRFASQASAEIKCPRCDCPGKKVARLESGQKAQGLKGYLKCDLKSMKCPMLHIRDLDPVTFRILHFIVHAALLAGSTLESSTSNELSELMQDDKPLDTCYEIIQVDLDVLSSLLCTKKERIITLLHYVIKEVSVLLTEDNISDEKKERSSWENEFAKRVLPLIQRFRKGQLIVVANESLEAMAEENQKPVFEDVNARNISIPRLFRITQLNTFNKLQDVYMYISEKEKEKHSLLGLFLDYHEDLQVISNLASLLSWSRLVGILLSKRLTRLEAKEKIIHDEIIGIEQRKQLQQVGVRATNDDLTKRECEEFIKAWNNVVPFMNEKHDSDVMPYISSGHYIGYCLAETQGLGRYLCKCFVRLAELQNEFLDKCLAIAISGKCSALNFLFKSRTSVCTIPVVHVQDAKQKEIISYKWNDRLLDFSYRETEYGEGMNITYDMEKIEKELAGEFLLGRAYLDTTGGIREFAFSKKLFHDNANIINELCKSIPQDTLPYSVEAELTDQSVYKIRTLIEDLELLLCSLRRTEVEPDPDHSLEEYIDTWMSSSRPFPKQVLSKTMKSIQIKHVCALYEFVEDMLAEHSMDCAGKDYRDKIANETSKKMREQLKDAGGKAQLESAITAIKRFAFRYLPMNPSNCSCLQESMKDPSLWPMALRVQRDYNVVEIVQKLFPVELTVGQTYEVHHIYHDLVQECNRTPAKLRRTPRKGKKKAQNSYS